MTTAENDANVLVFKNGEGDYFLVPRETIEQGRVPKERKAEVEQLIAEADDVHGHLFFAGVFVGVLIGGGATVATVAYHTDGGDGGSGHSGGQQQQIEAIVQNAQSIVNGGGRGRP